MLIVLICGRPCIAVGLRRFIRRLYRALSLSLVALGYEVGLARTPCHQEYHAGCGYQNHRERCVTQCQWREKSFPPRVALSAGRRFSFSLDQRTAADRQLRNYLATIITID